MAWEVVFAARSKNDLQQIVDYVARDDPGAAERLGLSLIRHAEFLAQAPEMGTRLPGRSTTRFLPLGSYLIIYRPDEKRRIVRILRFWHAARRKRPIR
jgi:plasmid stabilization system protein ParE